MSDTPTSNLTSNSTGPRLPRELANQVRTYVADYASLRSLAWADEVHAPHLRLRYYVNKQFDMIFAKRRAKEEAKRFRGIFESIDDWKLKQVKDLQACHRVPREFLFTPKEFFTFEGKEGESIEGKVKSFFKEYSTDNHDVYKALVLLICRQFSPPPSYLKKDYRNVEEGQFTKDQREWMEMTGILFKLLRKEMLKAPDELRKDLHTHLHWFCPTTAARLPDERYCTIMIMAFGCHFVRPDIAVELAWASYYEGDTSIDDRIRPNSFSYSLAQGVAREGFCNQVESLSGVLELLLDEAKVLEKGIEENSPTSTQGTPMGDILQEGLLFRIKPHLKPEKLDLFYKFPQKEAEIAAAFRLLLAAKYNATLSVRDVQDMFFSIAGIGRRRWLEQRHSTKPRGYFNGGESELLPVMLDNWRGNIADLLSDELHGSFLHHLMVYRAPNTILKVLEVLRKAQGDMFNANHIDAHNISPPLTHIMRQAVESRFILDCQWAFKLNNVAESIRHVIREGGNPYLKDETPELSEGFEVNAVVYASLDEKLRPLLRALLAGKNALETVSDALLDKWYNDSGFWKTQTKCLNMTKEKLLKKIDDRVKQAGD
ncbi:hypothetical protein BJ508DRAFT_306364 [Ascobolus immersus RN42]|uniref:Uncharacterized protein n=1 Tax=Ascobolus immersus RN42 TaxID=1160509 RepID=A0A3N4I6Q4_ASCIM|nr:hypothetical protein BJ508DRAFT_306364 [Ascobolus immersus RN42]